jgi:predicted  nucleic acid-binding Zn-ribbon protein
MTDQASALAPSQDRAPPVSDVLRMQAAMAELDRVRKTIGARDGDDLCELVEEVVEDRNRFESDFLDVQSDMEAMEEEAYAFRDRVDDLARLRTAIKAGRSDAALFDLERILSELDSAWRTRA